MMQKTSFGKLKFVNRDLLKWIALFFMGMGHFLLYTANEFHFFGLSSPVVRFFIMMEYFAPPVFFFFIAEGYRYTHSKMNYFIRLLVMTVVTQIPYVLYHTYEQTHAISFDFLTFLTNWSVIATLLLGFIAIAIWDSSYHLALKVAGIITLFYNGKKGHFPKLSKYFFYYFYPAHLLLIYILKIL